MQSVKIYDTTLRDGNQARNISLSLDDKLNITEKLDQLGIHYIEGGWPNATNPIDLEFYKEVRKLSLKTAKIAAFGSTRRPGNTVDKDETLRYLIETEAPVLTIFGKSWDLHVTRVIRCPLDENVRMIGESVAYLKKHCEEVIYDAEHFFDGYKNNPDYAMETLRAAVEGGADCIVLCDTNGGCLPMDYEAIVRKVAQVFPLTQIGVHNHNDSGCAVANSVVGVAAGAVHVQGTINGYGERCGNGNLCTIIPNLEMKMGCHCIGRENLKMLTEVSRFVDDIANVHSDSRLPYVGHSAFAHKGGMHIDGVLKVSESFEHINPETVGNARIYVLSSQSGGSTVVKKLEQFFPDIDKRDPRIKDLLLKVKDMEADGYQFDAADGSFKLLAKRALGLFKEPFTFTGFRVIEEKRGTEVSLSEATIKVHRDGEEVHTAADGDGPVSAIDNAFRKALQQFYPQLQDVRLVDYKVLVINGKSGTSAKVRVLIQSTDGKDHWGTVGVSENIIEASWIALIDSFQYKLMKDGI